MLTQMESACANTILGYFLEHDKPITHMKIQKLYYFSASQHLVLHDRCISEHNFQTWPHGPVLPNLYHNLSGYGDRSVKEYIELNGEVFYYDNGSIFDTIISVINELKNYTAWQLSEKSHAIDGPWYKTLMEHNQYKKDIQWSIIKEYYAQNPIIP